ncbi:hypothetical protein MKEN_00550400 [Mycena kentingensis (nom. inval.)]|nr:hypothetical protein MKEN_00550400 [Mycena kentingensis (nom. inval.)]
MHLAVLVLVATTLVAGAPTRHTRTPLKRDVLCPSADKTGAAFTASTTQEEAGNLFAVCSYGTSSVGCTYFTDGSFSAGGSSCPKGLVQNSSFEAGQGSSGNTNADDGDTGSDTTPAPQQPPSQQPSSSGGSIDSSIECPSADDDGTPLTGSSKTNDDVGNEFALCTYQGAGPCTYFFADGSFSSGSSQCPNGQAQVDDSPASPPPATTPPPPATSTTPPPPPPPTTTPPAPETTITPVAPPPGDDFDQYHSAARRPAHHAPCNSRPSALDLHPDRPHHRHRRAALLRVGHGHVQQHAGAAGLPVWRQPAGAGCQCACGGAGRCWVGECFGWGFSKRE